MLEQDKRPKWLYRAERTDEWGQGLNITFVTGLTLNLLPEDEPHDPDSRWIEDPLYHEIGEGGVDAPIYLPEGGLVEGQLYRLRYEGYADFETGIVDDYDVYIVPVEE